MSRFEDHGTLDIAVDGQIVILEGTGPWNVESLEKSGEIADPLVKPLLGKPWAVLAILYGQAIYVPEAAANLSKVVANDKANGRVATAVLINGCDSPRFTKTHISEIYSKAGEDFEFFDDVSAATTWLREKLRQSTV